MFLCCNQKVQQRYGIFSLFQWVHKIIDKTEREKCQYQDNQKENETT